LFIWHMLAGIQAAGTTAASVKAHTQFKPAACT